MAKPTICLDFDGVIHSYEHGWQDGSIYGTVVPGFWEWAMRAQEHFTLVVYSSRSRDQEQRDRLEKWLMMHQTVHREASHTHKWVIFEFSDVKPPAFLTIDDRALQFRGDWTAWWLAPEQLLKFKPWTASAPSGCDSKPAAARPWDGMSMQELADAIVSRQGVFNALHKAVADGEAVKFLGALRDARPSLLGRDT